MRLISPGVGPGLLRVRGSTTIDRHPLQGLVADAWTRPHTVRLADASDIELAEQLGVALLTTDAVLAAMTDRSELAESSPQSTGPTRA